MKKISLSIILILLIFAQSCNKEPDPTFSQGTKDPVVYDNIKILDNFVSKYREKFQVFKINAANGGIITSKNGVKYTIPAYGFIDASGNTVTGNIDISIKEILSVPSMILSDKPTITNDGSLLESFGEFFVKVEQNNQPLRARIDSNTLNAGIVIALRNKGQPQTKLPLWGGDTTIEHISTGYDYQNTLVTKTTSLVINKGIDWKEELGKSGFQDVDTIRFELPELFKWCNVDVIANLSSEKTTVLCYFKNHYNESTSTNYTGLQASMCFFKPDGVKTVVKLYNTIVDPPSGFEGFLSYQNCMPVGVTGTFLAVTIEDEKFYFEKKRVTIAAPSAGKNYSTVDFNLTETTETNLLNEINSL